MKTSKAQLKQLVETNRDEIVALLNDENLRRRQDRSQLEFVMANVEQTRSLYRIPKTYGMPVERYTKMIEYLMWMSAGLSGSELTGLIETANDELAKAYAGQKSKPTVVGAVLNQIEERQNLIIHTELIYQFVAVQLILDDEDPYVFSQAAQDEKVQILKDVVEKGSVHDFFLLPELKAVNDSLKLSNDELTVLWNESIREQMLLKKKIEFMKSGSVSVNNRTTSAPS